jgi:transcriptional regulator with XRE-family HTH domain
MGSKVTELPKGIYLTISQLAEEIGVARETIGKRMSEAGVRPAGKRGNYDIYRLRDALAAIQVADEVVNPDKLKPFERRAHYQAELEKLKLETEQRYLIPFIEVEQEQARLFKIVARTFDTLPDILERDCGLPPKVVTRVEKACDKAREECYQEIIGGADDGDVDASERA